MRPAAPAGPAGTIGPRRRPAGGIRTVAVLLLLLPGLSGCQTLPDSGGRRSSNFVEVFPGTGMPDFPDGGSR